MGTFVNIQNISTSAYKFIHVRNLQQNMFTPIQKPEMSTIN